MNLWSLGTLSEVSRTLGADPEPAFMSQGNDVEGEGGLKRAHWQDQQAQVSCFV